MTVDDGRFTELTSDTILPVFPRSISDVSVEAAESICRGLRERYFRLCVHVRLPNYSATQVPSGSGQVREVPLGDVFGGVSATDVRNGVPENPLMFLLCHKLAHQLGERGFKQIRFITQNVQSAMRLQTFMAHQRPKVDMVRFSEFQFNDNRISVLGMNPPADKDKDSRTNSKETRKAILEDQQHFGISSEDEIVIVVAPSTEQRATTHMLSALENLAGAATSRKKPIVFLNPELVRRTRFGAGTPYLLAGFQTVFFIDPCAWRRDSSCSCGLLRRWPGQWEVFFHDVRCADKGYVFFGTCFNQPSADWFGVKLKEFNIFAGGSPR